MDDQKKHNDLLKETFDDLLDSLSSKEKEVKGEFLNVWPTAAIACKNLDMMVLLEDQDESKDIDNVFCFMPEVLSESQKNYFVDRYQKSNHDFYIMKLKGEEFYYQVEGQKSSEVIPLISEENSRKR